MFYNQSYKDKTKKQLVEIGVEHVKKVYEFEPGSTPYILFVS